MVRENVPVLGEFIHPLIKYEPPNDFNHHKQEANHYYLEVRDTDDYKKNNTQSFPHVAWSEPHT